jgi:hypothetical protein
MKKLRRENFMFKNRKFEVGIRQSRGDLISAVHFLWIMGMIVLLFVSIYHSPLYGNDFTWTAPTFLFMFLAELCLDFYGKVQYGVSMWKHWC